MNITERKLSAHFNISIPLSASSWDKLVSFSTTFSAQYRSIADFSVELLKESRVNLNYIKRALRIMENANGNGSGIDFQQYKDGIKESMDDDFNTRGALRSILDIAEKVVEKETSLSHEEALKGIETLKWADSFLSVIF